MNWKQHLPLALATGVIVLTLAICTALQLRELAHVNRTLVGLAQDFELSRR